jgi:hypothetical protein
MSTGLQLIEIFSHEKIVHLKLAKAAAFTLLPSTAQSKFKLLQSNTAKFLVYIVGTTCAVCECMNAESTLQSRKCVLLKINTLILVFKCLPLIRWLKCR